MGKKGQNFERELCNKLSLWWTGGNSDDVFWRTAGSGARATVRGKVGKRTRGHSGDICSTDDCGKPLTDLVTIEIKRGYSKHTIADVLDKPLHAAEQKFEEWIKQARRSSEIAGTPFWMIIQKRDMRQALVFFHPGLYNTLKVEINEPLLPLFRLRSEEYAIFGTTLKAFLDWVDPRDIKSVSRRL